MELNFERIQKICHLESIQITIHAAKRLEQRGISIDDIVACILSGEIIEHYPTDYPFPSCLVLGLSIQQNVLHIVVGTDYTTLWIVTAYKPDSNKWQSDFKTRKEN